MCDRTVLLGFTVKLASVMLTSMWRRVVGFVLTCGGIFAIVGWLVRDRSAKQGKRSREIQTDDQLVKPVTPKASTSSRRKISLAGIASGLTLILAYMAVAVNAHWFPWQTSIASITLNLDSGLLSDASWNSNVEDLMDFLNSHKMEVVHLNLIMHSNSELFSAQTFSYSNRFLYVETKPTVGTTDISMGAYCANLGQFKCTGLTVYIVTGPGSNLGYDDGDTAATARLDGYFQVGKGFCQSYFCRIDIIPVEPPS